MLKKIILIYPNFFRERDYVRFGCHYFYKKNLTFEVWNVLPIIDNNIAKSLLNKFNETDKVKIKIFNKKDDLQKALNYINRNEDVVMVIMKLNHLNEWIFRYLEYNNIFWGQHQGSIYPEGNISLINKIRILFMNNKLIQAKLSILVRKFKLIFIYNKKKEIIYYKPSFFIFSGKYGEHKSSFELSNKCEKINTHAFAYNEYLTLKNKDKINYELSTIYKSKYVVYLDEDVPNHKDPFYHGYKRSLCDSEIFFNEVNNFLEYIENKFNTQVIIAGYPKSNYENNNPFNRKIIYNNTLDLIKNSYFVLQHNSTAINYSIMLKKPVIFLNSENYLLHFKISIDHLANELGKQSIYLSSKKNPTIDLGVNEKIYKNYFENFITNNKKELNKTSHEIIYEKLFSMIKNKNNS